MSVEASSVHAAVLWVDHSSCVSGREVDGSLASLFGLRTLVGGKKGERRAGGHGVFTAGVLLPQVLCDDAVQRGGGGQVSVQLFLHGWTLTKGAVVRLLTQDTRFLAAR